MYRIGIDLGGTNIAAGVIDEKYGIVAQVAVPTGAERPASEIINDICAAAEAALGKAGITAGECVSLGIGVPGTCIPETGTVARACNLNWYDVPLADMIEKRMGLPVRIGNDANCAALAECVAGAAKGVKNAVLVTLGTGVGGGVIVDGRVYGGRGGAGTEVGHICIDMNGEMCSCGRQGCWEACASVSALIRQAKDAAEKNADSLLAKAEQINGVAIFDAAKQGDETAKKVIDGYCRYVAVGVADLVNIFAPDMVLIGGGISRQGETLIAPVREYAARWFFDKRTETIPEIRCALLGNEAGIIGAAAL